MFAEAVGIWSMRSVQGNLSSIMGSLLAHRPIQKPSRPMTTEEIGISSMQHRIITA